MKCYKDMILVTRGQTTKKGDNAPGKMLNQLKNKGGCLVGNFTWYFLLLLKPRKRGWEMLITK